MRKAQLERFAKWSDEDRKNWGQKMSKYNKGGPKPKVSESMKNNKNGALYSIEQVKEIRRLHEKENKGYTEISELLHIPRPAVYLIATYRRWKDI